jgi:hypothetical protein
MFQNWYHDVVSLDYASLDYAFLDYASLNYASLNYASLVPCLPCTMPPLYIASLVRSSPCK